jgi:hypothetical protein
VAWKRRDSRNPAQTKIWGGHLTRNKTTATLCSPWLIFLGRGFDDFDPISAGKLQALAKTLVIVLQIGTYLSIQKRDTEGRWVTGPSTQPGVEEFS